MNRANGELAKGLMEIATDCGGDLFGIADASDFSSYIDRRNPCFYIDEAKSVIVIGYHVNDPMFDIWTRSIDGKRYVSYINEIIGNVALEIISALLKEGKKAILTPYSGVFAKDAAVLAGLGMIGRNNLLLTERFGPRVRLRTIITDAELTKSPRKNLHFCDNCPSLCWSACPADAFAAGKFNRDACIEYSDKYGKKLSDNSFLYCRECELACPVGER